MDRNPGYAGESDIPNRQFSGHSGTVQKESAIDAGGPQGNVAHGQVGARSRRKHLNDIFRSPIDGEGFLFKPEGSGKTNRHTGSIDIQGQRTAGPGDIIGIPKAHIHKGETVTRIDLHS